MQSSRAPILLTGANGQVGAELLPALRALGPVIAPTRAELDLSDLTALRQFISSLRPRWIVNPAAYTAVDKAENDVHAAYAINRDAVRVLGEEAARLGAAVLHFSTDYVFSGEGSAPWREDDRTGPLSVYGASKLAGEQALAKTGAAQITFRTSWVYGVREKNFLLTILRAAREKDQLSIVDDQFGAPTWSRSLARLAVHTLHGCQARADAAGIGLSEAVQTVSGVYHGCDAGCTTWFGFAVHCLELAQRAQPNQRLATCHPVSTDSYPTPARRPRNSRLNCDKLNQILEYTMPPWQESAATVMAELMHPTQP